MNLMLMLNIRPAAFLVLMFIPILAVAAQDGPEQDRLNHHLGASLGLPTFLSAACEMNIEDDLVLGLNGGSMIIAHSLGARLIYGSNDPGWRIRFFAGASLIDSWYANKMEDPIGTSLHGWTGLNLVLNSNGWRFVVELGTLIGGDYDKGLGFSGLTPSWGISLMHSI